MAQELLVVEQKDAGADFVRNFNEYMPVSVAFWIHPSDSEEACLYIASDEITDKTFVDAYGEVLRRMFANRTQWLDPFQIKLVSSSDPLAVAAKEIRDRYPARIPTHYNSSFMGGMDIDSAYIYPPLKS